MMLVCLAFYGWKPLLQPPSNPQMEAYYVESKGLSAVTIDSVTLFKNKVEGFVTTHPIAKEHEKYPLIQANIKSASLRLTITVDTTWAGEKTINF